MRLFTRSVPRAQLRETVGGPGEGVMEKNPVALRACKEAYKLCKNMDFPAAEDYLVAKSNPCTGLIRERLRKGNRAVYTTKSDIVRVSRITDREMKGRLSLNVAGSGRRNSIGDTVQSRGRTVTENDVVSSVISRETWFGSSNVRWRRRLSTGTLVQGGSSFPDSRLVVWDPRYVIAFYGVDRPGVYARCFIGDTVSARIWGGQESRDEATAVTFQIEVVN